MYRSKYNYGKICISYLRIYGVSSMTTGTLTSKLICKCSSCKYNTNIRKMKVFFLKMKVFFLVKKDEKNYARL